MGRKKVRQYVLNHTGSIEQKVQVALNLLDMTGAAAALPGIASIASQKKLSSLEYVYRLLEEEYNRKEDMRIERWTKQAKFPWIKTIKEYDFKYPEYIDKENILAHRDCSWIDKGGKMIFLGPPGVGKTHLSIAMGLEAIQQGYEAKFLTVNRLTEAIDTAIKKDEEQGRVNNRKNLQKTLEAVPLLILDEMSNSKINEKVGDFLYQVIHGRANAKRALIITATRHFSEWKNWFGNDSNTESAVDRIIENSSIFSIKGKSYRPKSSKTFNGKRGD